MCSHNAPALSRENIASEFESLTPAEAELVSDLVAGLSLGEIAENTWRSKETVRSLLKRVFRKTGTHR